MRARAAIATASLLWTLLGAAGAAPAYAGNLVDGAYNVDIFYGPAFGSTRIIALGGAYAAIAEGAEGVLHNPAAVANRYRYSLKWFDYDLGFDYYLFPLGDRTDFDNDRRTRYMGLKQFMFFLAPALHFGNFSFAFNWVHQAFSYTTARGFPEFDGDLDVDVMHIAAGYRFFKGGLVVGVSTRFHSLNVQGCTLASPVGGSGSTFRPELGVLIRPSSVPLRIGVAVRTPSKTAALPDVRPAECDLELPLPDRVVLPFELQLGFAFSIGDRVLNRPWINPRAREREREREIAAIREDRRMELREKLEATPPDARVRIAREWDEREKKIRADEDALFETWSKHIVEHDKARLRTEDRLNTTFSADLLFTGRVADALGVEQAVAAAPPGTALGFTSGARFTVTPRVGVESEVWNDRMKVRGGFYLEPGRYDGTTARPHVTSGVELRLFYFTPPILLDRFGVRAGATMDVAPRYVNVSVSIGTWH